MSASLGDVRYLMWKEGMSYCVGSNLKARIRRTHRVPPNKDWFQPPPLVEIEVVDHKCRSRNCLWLCVNLSITSRGLVEMYVARTLEDSLRRKRELKHSIKMSDPIKVKYVPASEPTVEDMEELKNAK